MSRVRRKSVPYNVRSYWHFILCDNLGVSAAFLSRVCIVLWSTFPFRELDKRMWIFVQAVSISRPSPSFQVVSLSLSLRHFRSEIQADLFISKRRVPRRTSSSMCVWRVPWSVTMTRKQLLNCREVSCQKWLWDFVSFIFVPSSSFFFTSYWWHIDSDSRSYTYRSFRIPFIWSWSLDDDVFAIIFTTHRFLRTCALYDCRWFFFSFRVVLHVSFHVLGFRGHVLPFSATFLYFIFLTFFSISVLFTFLKTFLRFFFSPCFFSF